MEITVDQIGLETSRYVHDGWLHVPLDTYEGEIVLNALVITLARYPQNIQLIKKIKELAGVD